jgi:hypothetical protein
MEDNSALVIFILIYSLIVLPVLSFYVIRTLKCRKLLVIPLLLLELFLPAYLSYLYKHSIGSWPIVQLNVLISVYVILKLYDLLYSNEPPSVCANFAKFSIWFLCWGTVLFHKSYNNPRATTLKKLLEHIAYFMLSSALSVVILLFHSKFNYYLNQNFVVSCIYHFLFIVLFYVGAKATFGLLPTIIQLIYGDHIYVDIDPWSSLHTITSLKQFWAEWNKPVHHACVKYIYKRSNPATVLLVFACSGLLHEWQSYCCNHGRITGLMFLFFVLQFPALLFEQFYHTLVASIALKRLFVFSWLLVSSGLFMHQFGLDVVQFAKLNLGQDYTEQM